MRSFQIEIIVRSIQVCRHDRDEIGAVLAVVALAHNNAGDFCDCVGTISLFKRTREKFVLMYRLGGKFRIDARTSKKKELFDTTCMGCLYNIEFNRKILANEICRIGFVRHNTTDLCRREKYVLWLLFFKEGPHCVLVKKVEFGTSSQNKVMISRFLKRTNKRRAHESFVSSNKNLRVFVHARNPLLPLVSPVL